MSLGETVTRLAGVPGEQRTTIAYAGPSELRDDLPGRTTEQARQITRDLLQRTANAVADAQGAVGSLGGGYPSSFDNALVYLRSRNQAALAAAQASDPVRALADVRKISDEAIETARSLVEAARSASGRVS